MRAYACVRGEYPPYGGRGRVRTYACGLHTFSTRPDTYVRVRTHVDSARFPRGPIRTYAYVRMWTPRIRIFRILLRIFLRIFRILLRIFRIFLRILLRILRILLRIFRIMARLGPIELSRLIRLPAHTPICL